MDISEQKQQTANTDLVKVGFNTPKVPLAVNNNVGNLPV